MSWLHYIFPTDWSEIASPPEALKLAERHSMKPVFSTVRMYTLRIPPIFIEQVFGATTLELG